MTTDSDFMPPFDRRRSGILLHPTSLPGPDARGVLGADAYRFVDFLADSGVTVWQCLPLGPMHADGSPYQTLSVHAGCLALIDWARCREAGWLDDDGPAQASTADQASLREDRLRRTLNGFQRQASLADRQHYERFKADRRPWLEDFVLFSAIKVEQGDRPWWDWSRELRNRDAETLAQFQSSHSERLEAYRFGQYLFFRQWHDLKTYANERGVLLFGDMPIFVAHDSAEVWARRDLFSLDAEGRALTVAGVPPDYFSSTGQRWGNPHYNWEAMQAEGFTWWIERMGTQLELFDLVRIDHFRGFEAYWEIPAHETTAINGRWVPAPGRALFERLWEAFGELPVVAEDLGIITEEVERLRRDFGMPGMKILQFAFDSGDDNPYLPPNHEPLAIVYTGTHDNNTSLGWFQSLEDWHRQRVLDYLGHPQEPMPWPLIRTALESIARMAVIPMQDYLGLDTRGRMNQPGTIDPSNWSWRFQWNEVPDGLAEHIRTLNEHFDRIP